MKAEHCISVTSSINIRELRVLCSLSLAPWNENMKKKTHGVMYDPRVMSSVCLSGIHSINNSNCSREKMCVFSVMSRKDCYVLFKRLHFNLQWKHIDIRVPQRIIRKDSGDCRTVFLCRNNSKPLQRPIRLFMMRYHRKWANYKRHCGCSWSSDDEPLAQSEKVLDCTQEDIRLWDGPAHFGRSLINVGQKLKLIGF